jgi:pyruvate dehydrogenase E1 component
MTATPKQTVTHSADTDIDSEETKEWLEALDGVISVEGPERASYLIRKQIEFARVNGVVQPFHAQTPYINTIPVEKQAPLPGNQSIERKIRSYTRWNAMAMVLRANHDSNVGGHISSFQSAATLYDVGFNHFWHAPSENHGGDLVFVQGHCAPGIYARSFLQGRLTEEQLINFRREVNGKGISSYPHPWLMPEYWQFPTVSMGLGPIMAIYQARFMKYLDDRGLAKTEGRKVWAFLGDGETDEPESLGAIGLAGREKLDNLIFVINCNLQRLDGPVRGNGSIIQDLESEFRGSGWNVIKVIWGRNWDILFSRDKEGHLMKRLGEIVDGEYQTFRSKDGAYIREHVFNTPELRALVADWSDEDIWNLNRGGHDVYKIYAAYHSAVNHKGQPTVILAKTVKGYWMGKSGQAMNIAHQQKHMSDVDVKAFRNHFGIPVPDEKLEELPFVKFPDDSPEMNYLKAKAQELGELPMRRTKSISLKVPGLEEFSALLSASEGKEFSTTMAFVRMLNILLKDKEIGKRIVPIIPDESRTFGMEGLFRQIGIWSHVGQLYTPQDKDQLMFYKEDKQGQVLQEGINEAGAVCDWIAAGTAYSTHGTPMIPFYIFYSMFGFQRIGDLAWAAGDIRCRGFLLGGTSGRTTLNGEGLQHEDGHSHIWSAAIPNCISYDPTFGYEVAVIIQDGLRRMYLEQEDIFYYITVLNENYAHPSLPVSSEQNILKGMYSYSRSEVNKSGLHVQLLGSGAIFREVIAAAELLRNDWGVSSDIWGCPSFTELNRDWIKVSRENLLDPESSPKLSHVENCLKDTKGPVIASTDYVRMFAEQIRPAIQNIGKRYTVLGTDGFGRSDTREQLRSFFEVNRFWVTISALKALADEGTLDRKKVKEAIVKYGIDPKKTNPITV